jgi:hypothetical protein
VTWLGAPNRRNAWGAVLVGAVVASALAGSADAAPKPPPPAVDIVVAIRTGGVCGTFAQSLPTLVSKTDMRPGDRIDPIEICLRNVGTAKGAARLTVIDRVDSETGCSAGEAAADASCGGTGIGELGGQLVVPIAIRPGCTGKLSSAIGYPFDTLTRSSAPVDTLRPGASSCVVLGLEYRPSSITAAAASQTDRVTWRYAFDLTQ